MSEILDALRNAERIRQPTERELRTLLHRAEPPRVVPLRRIINAVAWLAVLSLIAGYLLGRAVA
jgi:hypothetical protein